MRIPTLLLVLAACLPRIAATQLSPKAKATVDADVQYLLDRTQVPAISIALVQNRRIVYLHAYGNAGLNPTRAATLKTRFPIGSISKQFTAAAILLLADRGKLSLDDPVAKFLPALTRSREVTLRDLLAHTSGYRDYFTQEYIPAESQRPTTVEAILRRWAQIPLDFDPGTQWQYSSTNYVIAGRIVEIVSGEPFFQFLTENILRPVGITDAVLADENPASPRDARGYIRFALGPARPAPVTGKNWLFAMASLSMTAEDLAKWDLSILNQTLLTPAGYRALETPVHLRNGDSTGYGLGLFIENAAGPNGSTHTLLHHAGEISGFRAHNYLVPEAGTAVVILTNAEFSEATTDLAKRLAIVLNLAPDPTPHAAENPQEARARALLTQLAQGRIDRTQLTPEAAAVFTSQALRDIEQSLQPLGNLERVTLDSASLRGGTTHLALTAKFQWRTLQIAEYDLPNGTIQQFMIDDTAQ